MNSLSRLYRVSYLHYEYRVRHGWSGVRKTAGERVRKNVCACTHTKADILLCSLMLHVVCMLYFFAAGLNFGTATVSSISSAPPGTLLSVSLMTYGSWLPLIQQCDLAYSANHAL